MLCFLHELIALHILPSSALFWHAVLHFIVLALATIVMLAVCKATLLYITSLRDDCCVCISLARLLIVTPGCVQVTSPTWQMWAPSTSGTRWRRCPTMQASSPTGITCSRQQICC